MENSVSIKTKVLAHGVGLPLPQRMTSGSSGCDVQAAISTDITLKQLERAIIPTGFCFEIPLGYEIQVRPRSGLAAKHGITVLNTPGTIDADYRGEVKIIIINLGNDSFTIKRGERIAQLIPAIVTDTSIFLEVEELSDTCRGTGGFGHTGR